MINLVKLTRPDGVPLWINPDQVCSFSAVLNDYQAGKTALVLGGYQQAVLESPEQVADALALQVRP